MAKKACPTGETWVNIVKHCVFVKNKPQTTTERLTTMTPPPHSPVVWISVLVVTVGSLLGLVLWFVIYKQQSRLKSTAVKAEPVEQPLLSETNGQVEGAVGAFLVCQHMHVGAQTGFREEGFTACRDTVKYEAEGMPTCSTVREHTIPLPATELGGTALVTTKTV